MREIRAVGRHEDWELFIYLLWLLNVSAAGCFIGAYRGRRCIDMLTCCHAGYHIAETLATSTSTNPMTQALKVARLTIFIQYSACLGIKLALFPYHTQPLRRFWGIMGCWQI